MAADQWRWTDDEGVQRLLGADELRTALSDGRLKASTLVWKRGMPSWVPASEVPELMAALDDGPDTLTKERPVKLGGLTGALGKKAKPTPSIPAPGIFPASVKTPGLPGQPPSNMVDIAGLRAAQGRPASNTLVGVGNDKKKKDAGARAEVQIPAAPKLPSMQKSRWDKKPKPDGGWKEGAAREQDEETVTKLRDEGDPSTVEATKRRKAKARPAIGGKSVPPPRKKRPRNTQRAGTSTNVLQSKSKRAPPPARKRPATKPGLPKTLVSPKDKQATAKRRPSTAPPPVKSSAVLSEAFPSAAGKDKAPGSTLVSANETEQQEIIARAKRPDRDPVGLKPTLAGPTIVGEKEDLGRRIVPTAPLPMFAKPADADKSPSPAFAKEAWGTSDGPPAAFERKHTLPGGAKAPPHAHVQARSKSARPPKAIERRQAPPAVAAADSTAGQGRTEEIPQEQLLDRASAPLPPPPSDPGRIPQREIPTDVPPRLGPLDLGGVSGITLKVPVAIGAAVAAVALVVVSFVVGRISSQAKAGMAIVVARTGWVTVPLFARTRANAAPPRACLMLRAPSRVAGEATQRLPIELSPSGGRLAVGYGRTLSQAHGLMFDPATGSAEMTHEPDEGEKDLSRIVPIVQGDEVMFAETLKEDRGVYSAVYVNTEAPFVVGFNKTSAVRLDKPGEEAIEMWPLNPDDKGRPEALKIAPSAGGYGIAYRHNKQIYYGAVKADGAVAHAAKVVAGSGGIVGKPSVAVNHGDVSIVFADKPSPRNSAIELRWGRGKLGEPISDAMLMDLPAGGPGGDAQAPAVAALPNGRWIVMWTEGPRRGAKTLRAQTYDRKFRAVGDALRVSPATGSFGQGTIGVVGNEAVVMFLKATGGAFEVWGTVLQCR